MRAAATPEAGSSPGSGPPPRPPGGAGAGAGCPRRGIGSAPCGRFLFLLRRRPGSCQALSDPRELGSGRPAPQRPRPPPPRSLSGAARLSGGCGRPAPGGAVWGRGRGAGSSSIKFRTARSASGFACGGHGGACREGRYSDSGPPGGETACLAAAVGSTSLSSSSGRCGGREEPGGVSAHTMMAMLWLTEVDGSCLDPPVAFCL